MNGYFKYSVGRKIQALGAEIKCDTVSLHNKLLPSSQYNWNWTTEVPVKALLQLITEFSNFV